MTSMKIAVCVYCGSRVGTKPIYQHTAETLGKRLATDGHTLVYGAGSVGLMGVVARAVISAGGKAIGIIPEHLNKVEIVQDGLHETIQTQTMHDRKKIMFDRSGAFIVLPGGLGTMDEMFEVLTWAQLGLHNHPIIVLNADGFWTPLKDFVWYLESQGFVDAETLKKLRFVDTIDEAMAIINESDLQSAADTRSDLF